MFHTTADLRVRLTEFFSDKEDSSDSGDFQPNPFKPKSSWRPPRRCKFTESYLQAVESEFFNQLKKKPTFHRNLTAAENKALREISSNQDIVVKEADKGSGIVIMDRDRYIAEGLRQLSDSTSYRQLDSDPSPEFESQLKGLISQALQNGSITQEMADFAIPTSHKLARFYLLPKVHKAGVPGRPVVSCSGSLTEKTSAVVDFLVKPFVTAVDSYLRDTNHFLEKVRSLEPLPPDAILVTLDVVNLYPSIPNEDGISALSAFLQEQNMGNTKRQDICRLAHFVLSKNVFEFNSAIYIQISGTAIGTKMAPTYAIIFMHMVERRALSTALFKPWIWSRFIDDIWSVWAHGKEKLEEFILMLNKQHPRLTFTWEAGVGVNFMDVTTTIKDGKIVTELYVKPTDTHQYLHPNSCHPGHIKRSIAYSQSLRILNICSDGTSAEKHLDNLTKNLVKRGHSKHKVSQQVNRARQQFSEKIKALTRESSHPSSPSRAKSTKPRRIPLVLTYHPGLPDISAITRRLLPTLHCNPSMKELCPEPPLIAFRRPRNIRDHVIRAKIFPRDTAPTRYSCRPCSLKGPKRGRKCTLCTQIPEQSEIISSSNNKTFKLSLRSTADCDSTMVVYVITCTQCPERFQYVGQTNNFRKRMNNHKSCIRNSKKDDGDCALLYTHFALPSHSTETLQFTILEQCDDTASLLLSETRWMLRLKTVSPEGLNTNDGL